jgi:hypothetical protein
MREITFDARSSGSVAWSRWDGIYIVISYLSFVPVTYTCRVLVVVVIDVVGNIKINMQWSMAHSDNTIRYSTFLSQSLCSTWPSAYCNNNKATSGNLVLSEVLDTSPT